MEANNETNTDEYDYYDNYLDDNETEYICNMNRNLDMEIVIQTYVHSFICVFGLCGNALVIVTYAFYKKAKTMTDVYLLNVAVADLLFIVALPLIIYNEQHDWSMGSVVCKALRGAYSINLYSGMLLLACISGDRYISIVQARRSFGLRSRTLIYSRLICTAIWALAVALSIPTVIYNERVGETNGLGETIAVCQAQFKSNQTARLMKVLVPSLQVAMGFILPLLVMVLCYASIVWTLQRTHSTQRHKVPVATKVPVIELECLILRIQFMFLIESIKFILLYLLSLKAVRVVLAVVVVFIVCHLPYNVALLYQIVALFKERECEVENFLLTTLTITRSLAYLHCCINPILYAFIGVKFRNHFKKILEDMWCLGRKYIYPSGRSSCMTSDLYIPARKPTDGSNNENGSSFTL